MQHSPDHYAALGISPEADQDVIAAAYRALLKKYHPDTGTLRGTASKERLAEVLDAFEVLGNPGSRAAYDAERATQLAAPEDEEEPAALQSSTPPGWNSALGPAGERVARGRGPRRGAARTWMLLPVLLAGSGAAWLMTQDDIEPPPPPAAAVAPPPAETAPAKPVAKAGQPSPPAVAEEPPPPAPPPPEVQVPSPPKPSAKSAEPPPEEAELPDSPAPAQKPSAFVLVMGEDGSGAGSQGNIFFNTRDTCESFAARVMERRRSAALNQTGTAPGLWHECRPVQR